jgi:hypothetical protein
MQTNVAESHQFDLRESNSAYEANKKAMQGSIFSALPVQKARAFRNQAKSPKKHTSGGFA